jgi:DNA-binding HxlR family transcriptional regulator
MKTIQGSDMTTLIFIARWTPKILFSLHKKPYRHGELRRVSKGFHNGCLPELYAASKLRD